MGPRGAAGEERSGQVHAQDVVPGLVRFVGEHFTGAAARVVDEDVQSAVAADSFRYGGLDARAPRDVAGDETCFETILSDCFLNGSAFVFAPCEDCNLSSMSGAEASSRFADPAVASGDDRYFAIQTPCHVRVFLLEGARPVRAAVSRRP
jgi:hypothetical protein